MNKMPPWNSYPPVFQSVVGENDKDASLYVNSEPGSSGDKIPSRKNILIVFELMKGKGFSLGLLFPVEAKDKFNPWVGRWLKAKEGDAHFIFNYDDVEIILMFYEVYDIYFWSKYISSKTAEYIYLHVSQLIEIILIWITEYQSVMIFYYDRWKELQSKRTVFEGEKYSSISSGADRKEGGKGDCGNCNHLSWLGKEDISQWSSLGSCLKLKGKSCCKCWWQ